MKDPRSASYLLDTVKCWFSASHELELRIREQGEGLSCAEQRVLASLPPESKVLDIGCGAGRTAFALALEGHSVTGVDVSGELIRQARRGARRRGIRAEFRTCDPMELRSEQDPFDAALLLKTYCYVPGRGARVAWLAEMSRVLKPGGWLFLSQYIIDGIFDSYGPIREENRARFPDLADSLEDGDGFSVPPEGGTAAGFVHYFLKDDLLGELTESPFELVEQFQEDTVLYCALRDGGAGRTRRR